MDETPNDSGASVPSSGLAVTTTERRAEPPSEEDEPRWGESGIRRLNANELRVQIRRPAIWGLLLLIAVVIVVQLWLLFL